MRTLVKIVLAACVAGASVAAVIPQPVAMAGTQKADISAFIAKAKEAQGIAKAGDFKKSRERLKEIEQSWDDAEDQIRAVNQDGWRDADRKMDKTLDKLRDMKPDSKTVDDAFSAYIAALEALKK